MKNKLITAALLAACALTGTGLAAQYAKASDHDDGSQGTKSKATGLTDLYIFREKDQNPAASADDLIFVMNSNPRSEAGKDYYYGTDTRYEFHVARAKSNDAAPTGEGELVMRFEFGAPSTTTRQQALRMTFQDSGKDAVSAASTKAGGAILTTARGATPVINQLDVGGQEVTVFAGLREDPFFFDVDQFFKVRASAAARAGGDKQAQVVFRKPGVDFTAGLNVLSLVVRLPKQLLAMSGDPTSTYDVWETISVKK